MPSLKQWQDYFAQDRFAQRSGIRLLEISPGYAKAECVIDEHHLNAAGVVQGGAIFTLADFTFAAASNSHGSLTLAMQVSITYHAPAGKGKLLAVAREISRGRTTGSYEVSVEDESGRRIATFMGLGYNKGQAIILGSNGPESE